MQLIRGRYKRVRSYLNLKLKFYDYFSFHTALDIANITSVCKHMPVCVNVTYWSFLNILVKLVSVKKIDNVSFVLFILGLNNRFITIGDVSKQINRSKHPELVPRRYSK